MKVLATVLGGGMAGRLFAELRDKQALAYTASAFYEAVREPGVLVLYLGTAPENAARAEAALLQGDRARADGSRSAPTSWRGPRATCSGNYTMDRRTNARQAWYMAFYEVEGVGQQFPERYRRAVEAVTAADVLRVARAYLDPLTLVVLRPPATR